MSIVSTGNPFDFFDVDEIDSRGEIVWSPVLVRHGRMMDDLRRWREKPININSWFRSPEHNISVGGSKNSCHLTGEACDVALPRLTATEIREHIAAWKAICVVYGVIGGVGIYDWGLHVDSNNNPTRYGAYSNKFRVQDYRR